MYLLERAGGSDLLDAEGLLWQAEEKPLTSPAWLLPAHQQSDQCSTWLSSEPYYGNSCQEKFSAPVAIIRLSIFCQGTERIHLWAIRNTHVAL